MGHLVNANAFRLGYSKPWVSSWVEKTALYKQYLQQDFLIFRFINLFFKQYSIPVFTSIKNRRERGQNNNKISGQAKIIKNQFIDSTFIFSNVSISRLHTLEISSFFMDTLMDDWRLSFLRYVNNASLTFFQPKNQSRYKPKVFTDLKFLPKFYRKTLVIRRKKKKTYFSIRSSRRLTRVKRRHIFLIFIQRNLSKNKSRRPADRLRYITYVLHRKNWSVISRTRNKWSVGENKKKAKKIKQYVKSFKTLKNKIKIRTKPKFKGKGKRSLKQTKISLKNKQIFKFSKKQTKMRLPNVLNMLKFFPTVSYDKKFYPNPRGDIKNRFKLLKICLLLFQQKICSWKQQQFFIVLMKNLLLSTFLCPRFVPSFILFKLLNSLILREISFKHLNFYYFKKIFCERYIIFQSASSAIYSSVKSFDKNEKIRISFFGMHVRNISASFITNYIIIKLGQYFTIHDIVRPFLSRLKNTSYIQGFRIIVAGRLTRKERAAYIVRSAGDVTLGTKSCYIDYAADFKIMRFGVVGVKVWFNLTRIRPYYYVFRFKFMS